MADGLGSGWFRYTWIATNRRPQMLARGGRLVFRGIALAQAGSGRLTLPSRIRSFSAPATSSIR